MSLRSPASASSSNSHRRYFFPDHASTSSGSPHVCLSPLPVDDDDAFEYPYPFNRVHSSSRPSSLGPRRGRSRASSISSIVSVCSDQSDEDDANSIFSDVGCASTHTSCSSARDEMDEGKRKAFNSIANAPTRTVAFATSSATRPRPRGPRPLPKIPTRVAPSPAIASPTKPRILISLDPSFCIPYVQREEDDPYSATHSPSSAGMLLPDIKSDSDLDSPISPSRGNSKPRVRFADTLMREEDAEISPLDVLFDGVAEDDVIDWDRVEEFMHAWDGFGCELAGKDGRGLRCEQTCHG